MADMDERVALNYLVDFYGPLLTEHRQELLRLYCEEDLSQQEIADQLSITRQGVSDSLAKSKRQLAGYEAKLGLVERHLAQTRAAERCLKLLEGVRALPESADALEEARLKDKKFGSTKQGIAPFYSDKYQKKTKLIEYQKKKK